MTNQTRRMDTRTTEEIRKVRDEQDRLHGHAAVDLLMRSIPEGPGWNSGWPENSWNAADAAVEAADDETVRAALRHLLGLYIHNLEDTEPKVAMRNVRVGDEVRTDGTPHIVKQIIHPESQSIMLRLESGGQEGVINYDRDVRLDLVSRPAQKQPSGLPASISGDAKRLLATWGTVEVSESVGSRRYVLIATDTRWTLRIEYTLVTDSWLPTPTLGRFNFSPSRQITLAEALAFDPNDREAAMDLWDAARALSEGDGQ